MSEVVKLTKGENLNLTKDAPGLSSVTIGLGWDVNEGVSADLDASALLLKEDGKVRTDKDFVFFGNLESADGSVKHSGDNLTGAGDGDDEQIEVDLTKVPADVNSVKFVVNIYEARAKNQNFGQIKNAFVRLVNKTDGTEVVRYDLTEDFSGKESVFVAELYRNGSDWKFKALGEGNNEEVAATVRNYGVNA